MGWGTGTVTEGEHDSQSEPHAGEMLVGCCMDLVLSEGANKRASPSSCPSFTSQDHFGPCSP